MAPGRLRLVGGGGSLPHPPCEAKRATAMACTILPIEGNPAAASPVCWVLLGVGTHAVAGLAGFSQIRFGQGRTFVSPNHPADATSRAAFCAIAGITSKSFDSWIAAGVPIVQRPSGR